MITVKLYGLMRIEAGVRELRLECENVKELMAELQRYGLNKKDIKGCCILVNGEAADRRTRLLHGDEVQLLPPVAGG